MDYLKAPIVFKARKILRYVDIYGVDRTVVKVKGQQHLARTYDDLPVVAGEATSEKRIGILGCGNFAYTAAAYYLRRNYGYVIRGVMDIDPNRAASLGIAYEAVHAGTDPDRVIEDYDIDGLFITSNHASHAEYAIQALQHGKHVHIEKPHVVDHDQLRRLCASMDSSPGLVALGFNRPGSRLGRLVRDHLAAESGPAMLNWFVAGHELPSDHWYFAAEEGGRVLGNLCHWIDFVYHLVPPEERYPISIQPTCGEKSDCDIAVTYVFGNGTVAAITFSAMGHVFEGVRERFTAQRGNTLLALNDFKTLQADIGSKRHQYRNRYRDHGHQDRITASYEMMTAGISTEAASVDYVWEIGDLFLSTRLALDTNEQLVVHPYERDALPEVPAGTEQ